MAGGQEKWYFTKEQLQNSPSRKCGLDADKELAYRQQAANLIQDMGQRLQVSQLCINTAIVYMHRFYAFHSFTQFHRNAIAAAALFLAAKVEEQPRKLEYVIKVAHVCLHRSEGANNLTPEQYTEQAQDLVFNENVLLQTLGFDVAIDHPHTHVVRTCHLVKAPKDLAQTSYFMASNSLHLTTMCLQYKPTVVACFCIHLASKWSNWAIPQSSEGRHWFSYVDRSVTTDLLEKLTAEFLHIFDKCPSRLKRKMMTMSNTSGSSPSGAIPSSSSSPFDKKHAPQQDDFDKSFDKEYERERRRQPVPGGYVPACAAVPTQAASTGPPAGAPGPPAGAPGPPAAPPMKIDYNLYREKRDREERERQRQRGALAQGGGRPHAQHQPGSHQRSSSSSSSLGPQKPHHPWPHHKPPHKLPHDHRHHRPQPQAAATATSSNPHPPQPSTSDPPRTRPPSLFSPEAAGPPAGAPAAPPSLPPPQGPRRAPPPSRPKPEVRHPPQEVKEKPQPPSPKKRQDLSTTVKEMQPPAILSPFSSPQPVKELKHRQRQLSNSEPELIPVVKKLDETPGYENVVRDSQRGLRTKAQEVNSNININVNIKQEKKDLANRLNGIETDPTLVSNLLKESLAKPAPITVATEKPAIVEVKKEVVEPPQPTAPETVTAEEHEHKPKKEKKKKEKHKHKDRDKSKEERKKHKKDKDRDKRKDPSPAVAAAPATDGALRITIPRDGAPPQPPGAPAMASGPLQTGLKIKIPKERLAAPPPPPNASSLKIKISKEVLDASRKRPATSESGPASKMSRANGSHNHKVVEPAPSGPAK